jgi:hypothetical protein
MVHPTLTAGNASGLAMRSRSYSQLKSHRLQVLKHCDQRCGVRVQQRQISTADRKACTLPAAHDRACLTSDAANPANSIRRCIRTRAGAVPVCSAAAQATMRSMPCNACTRLQHIRYSAGTFSNRHKLQAYELEAGHMCTCTKSCHL